MHPPSGGEKLRPGGAMHLPTGEALFVKTMLPQGTRGSFPRRGMHFPRRGKSFGASRPDATPGDPG